MHRSYWDVEVYAKDFQERRQAEAAKQRRIDEAIGTRQAFVDPVNLGFARFLLSVRAWFSTNRHGRSARAAHNAAMVEDAPIAIADGQAPQPWPGRVSQPYADMVVIARGPAVRATEQPRVISDC